MDRLIMFLILSGIILTIVFAVRYLRVIPNYKNEYLLEFHSSKMIDPSTFQTIQGIYGVRKLNDHQYRIHFDSSVDQLKHHLTVSFSLNDQDVKIKQLHSWLKTNAWK